MIEPTPSNTVSTSVALDAANVALRDFSQHPLAGAPGVSEVEQLDLAFAMVEVEPSLACAAVNAPAFGAYLCKHIAVALDIPVCALVMRFAPLRVSGLHCVARTLALLVAFPCFRRVLIFAAGHMGILTASDTWGNEALQHVEVSV